MLQEVEVLLDDHGRILIPEALRDRLNLSVGMTFVVEKDAQGEVLLSPQTEPPILIDEDGILVATGELTGDVTDIVRHERNRRVLELLQRVLT